MRLIHTELRFGPRADGIAVAQSVGEGPKGTNCGVPTLWGARDGGDTSVLTHVKDARERARYLDILPRKTEGLTYCDVCPWAGPPPDLRDTFGKWLIDKVGWEADSTPKLCGFKRGRYFSRCCGLSSQLPARPTRGVLLGTGAVRSAFNLNIFAHRLSSISTASETLVA